MESLECKLDRLSPEQRREVEDFVDFLISRAGYVPAPQPIVAQGPVLKMVPPPLTAPEQIPVQDFSSSDVRNERPSDVAPVVVSRQSMPEDPEPVIQEITVGGSDWVTRDYLDYGQFEQQPSPATEAVKKVKAKIIQRGEQDKSRHLLDWID